MLECFDGLIDERKSRQEIGFLIGCVLEGFLVSFGTIRHHLPSFSTIYWHMHVSNAQQQ